LFRIALSHLLRSRLRTLLTLVGVAGSVALFVALSAISRDLKQQLDDTIAQSRIDVVIEQRGAATPLLSRILEGRDSHLRTLDGVASISSVVIGSVRVPRIPYLLLFGVSAPDTYRALGEWLGGGLVAGKMLRPGNNELILGQKAARRLNLTVGDELKIGNEAVYRVAGIYWLGQGLIDGGAIVDVTDSQTLLTRKGYVNLLLVEAIDKKKAAPLVKQINEQFADLHAFPAASIRRQIRAISMIDAFVTAVSATVLLLSGVLILNTMLMAISERTREIGILSAVGWSRAMVVQLLLLEACLLGLLGALLGYASAYPLLAMVSWLPEMPPGWIPAAPNSALLIEAVLLSVGIAALGALYPAFYATRLQPASALTYE
jgi:putative ABC transport system permease protein